MKSVSSISSIDFKKKTYDILGYDWPCPVDWGLVECFLSL